jgi:Terminase small subunit
MGVLENTRHEKFCQLRVLGKTQDEAYIEAGYSSKTARQHAHQLATKSYIKDRIAELQAVVVQKFEVTAESIAVELDRDRAFAYECKNPSAAVAATIGKAKLFGLMTDRSVVNVTHNYNMMTVEELRFEIAAITAEARAIKPGVQN